MTDNRLPDDLNYVITGETKYYDAVSSQPAAERVYPQQVPTDDYEWNYLLKGEDPQGTIQDPNEGTEPFVNYLRDKMALGDDGVVRGWVGLKAAAGMMSREEAEHLLAPTRLQTMREQRINSFQSSIAHKDEGWKALIGDAAESIPSIRESVYGGVLGAASGAAVGGGLGLAGGPFAELTVPAGILAGASFGGKAGLFITGSYLATGNLYWTLTHDMGLDENTAVNYATGGGALVGAAGSLEWNALSGLGKKAVVAALSEKSGQEMLKSTLAKYFQNIGANATGNMLQKMAEQVTLFLGGMAAKNETVTLKTWMDEIQSQLPAALSDDVDAFGQGAALGTATGTGVIAGAELTKMGRAVHQNAKNAADAMEAINNAHGFTPRLLQHKRQRNPQNFSLSASIDVVNEQLNHPDSANPTMLGVYQEFLQNEGTARREIEADQAARNDGRPSEVDKYRLAIARQTVNVRNFDGGTMHDFGNELKRMNETGTNAVLDGARKRQKRAERLEGEAHTAIMGDRQFTDEAGNLTGVNPEYTKNNFISAAKHWAAKRKANFGDIWNSMPEFMATLDQWNADPNKKRMVDIFDTTKEILSENEGINKGTVHLLERVAGEKRSVPLLRRMASGWLRHVDNFTPSHGVKDKYSRNEAIQLYMDLDSAAASKRLVEGNKFDLDLLREELDGYLTADDKAFAAGISKFNSEYVDGIHDFIEDTYGYRPAKDNSFSGLLDDDTVNIHSLEKGKVPGAVRSSNSTKRLGRRDAIMNALELVYGFEPAKAFTEKSFDAHSIFNAPKVRDLIKHRIGDHHTGLLDDSIADTVHDRSDQYVLHNKWLRTIRSNIGPAWTNMAPLNFFKQATGVFMVLGEGVDPRKIGAYTLDIVNNSKWYDDRLALSNLKGSRKGNVYQTKGGIKSGDVNAIDPDKMTLDDWLGIATSAGDLFPIDYGGRLVYKTAHDANLSLGEEAAHEAGLLAYERFGNGTQSSRLRDQRTPFDRGEAVFVIGGKTANAFLGAFSRPIQQAVAKQLNSVKFTASAIKSGKPGAGLKKIVSTVAATHLASFMFQFVQSTYSLGMTAFTHAIGASDEDWTDKLDEEIAKMAGAAVFGPFKDLPILGPLITAFRINYITNPLLNIKEKAWGMQYIPVEVGSRVVKLYNKLIDTTTRAPGELTSLREVFDMAKLAGYAAVAIPGQAGRLPYSRAIKNAEWLALPPEEDEKKKLPEKKKRIKHKAGDGPLLPNISDISPEDYYRIREMMHGDEDE